MTTATDRSFDAELDLILERVVDVPPELVWRAWTEPQLVKQWFTPSPWKTIDCEIDLKPGGIFATTMQSPEGQTFPNTGCYLEIVTGRRLVFTDALGAGYRPKAQSFMTAIITIEPSGSGTRYVAEARHKSEDDRKKHEEMGFHAGWGRALDQLVALAKTL